MKKKFSIAEIAKMINANVVGDDKLEISGVAALQDAGEGDLTFLLGGKYQSLLQHTKATAVILKSEDSKLCPSVSLIVENPEVSFAQIAQLFNPYIKPRAGVHPSATVSSTAIVPESVSVGANAVIGDNVSIGENTVIGSGVSINHDVVIGSHCFIMDQVVLYHRVTLGDSVILHAGAVIGADGFGFSQTSAGWQKVPQIGGVHIHSNVEIGANSCIDRGALSDTVIHEGVKIDNLVQIAHNVEVGKHTIIAGCSAIAGSTKIGAGCMIGGAVSIAGHLTICDGAVFTGNAMVTGSVSRPGVYSSGTGLMENGKWRKMAVRLRQLDGWMRKFK